MLTDAFIGEGPDIPEWEPATCEALIGHSIDLAWEGPETVALGISTAIHDTTKSTRDNEE